VCQAARSWVDVGSFYKRLVLMFMILQRQSGIFWINTRSEFVDLLYIQKAVFLFHLQILSETFLTLRRIQRDMTINVHSFSYTEWSKSHCAPDNYNTESFK
jgi:hypothetical protein